MAKREGGSVLATGSGSERERLDFIDGLRGFACLWVLIHHSFESLPAGHVADGFAFGFLAGFARIGWLGVSLFLVLSGFCLYYPLVRRTEPSVVKLQLRAFARRRALRILPPYMAIVALFTGIAWYAARHSLEWPETVRARDVLTHIFMVHNLWPSTFASINPALWSLALEVQLYMIFPLFVWIAARRGLKALAAAAFTVALIWQGLAWRKYGLSQEWQAPFAVAYHALPARCFEFAAGMIAAALVAHGNKTRISPNVSSTARTVQSKAALLLLAVLIGPALWFVLRVSRFGPLCDQAWGIIFATAVVLLARVPQTALQHRPLRWLTLLGTVSYSVYLVHQPIVQFLAPAHLHIPVSGPASLAVFVIVRLLIAIAIGVGFFHLLEKPCILRAARSARSPQTLHGATQQAT